MWYCGRMSQTVLGTREAMSNIQSTIRPPKTIADWDALRQLCWAYRQDLIDHDPLLARLIPLFYPEDKYTATLEKAEADHSPPNGDARLLIQNDKPAGCGMIHRFSDDTAEIKRVYLAPVARGTGHGRTMMQALIEATRSLGYTRIVMDTAAPLTDAQKLYDRMGFIRRDSYQPLPKEAEGHLVFYEMSL